MIDSVRDIKDKALLTDEEILEASQVNTFLPNGEPDLDCGYLTGRIQVCDAQLEKAYPIFFEAGYQAGLSQQETPRIDLECELADDEFRKEFHIAWKKGNMEMYKAGIKEGIKKGQRQIIKWLKEGSMDAHTHIFQVSEEKYQSTLKEVGE
uniref:Uncharacterized protein n=1 Tax=viral metagenome TaxID=1070528 RepID=A0A6M3Y225_9ZZZZ